MKSTIPFLYPFTTIALSMLIISSLNGCQQSNKNEHTESTAQSSQSGASTSITSRNTQPIEMIAEDVVRIKMGSIDQSTAFTGTVEVATQTSVQSQTNGTAQRVFADIGQAVKKGQILVQLSSPDDRSRLTQQQANLASAQAQAKLSQSLVERKKRLYNQGYISRLEYEQAQVDHTAQQENVRAQQANVAIAQKAAKDSIITSPLSGTVSQRAIEVGQSISMGQTVFEIVDNQDLEVKASMSIDAQTQLAIGQAVQLHVQGNSEPIPAHITRIAPVADSGMRNRIFYAKPDSMQSRLNVGAFVEGEIVQVGSQQGQLIPLGSIQNLNSRPSVWVIRNGKLYMVNIRVQQTDMQSDIALVSGLNNDDQVSLIQFTAADNGRTVVIQASTPPQ